MVALTNLRHVATPPGPVVVRGGFAVRAVDFAGSVAAFVSGVAAVESLRLLAASRFTAAAGSAVVAVVAWLLGEYEALLKIAECCADEEDA